MTLLSVTSRIGPHAASPEVMPNLHSCWPICRPVATPETGSEAAIAEVWGTLSPLSAIRPMSCVFAVNSLADRLAELAQRRVGQDPAQVHGHLAGLAGPVAVTGGENCGLTGAGAHQKPGRTPHSAGTVGVVDVDACTGANRTCRRQVDRRQQGARGGFMRRGERC